MPPWELRAGSGYRHPRGHERSAAASERRPPTDLARSRARRPRQRDRPVRLARIRPSKRPTETTRVSGATERSRPGHGSIRMHLGMSDVCRNRRNDRIAHKYIHAPSPLQVKHRFRPVDMSTDRASHSMHNSQTRVRWGHRPNMPTPARQRRRLGMSHTGTRVSTCGFSTQPSRPGFVRQRVVSHAGRSTTVGVAEHVRRPTRLRRAARSTGTAPSRASAPQAADGRRSATSTGPAQLRHPAATTSASPKCSPQPRFANLPITVR
jgi:hypothetical protein